MVSQMVMVEEFFFGESSNAHISGNTTIIGNSANYGGGISLEHYSIMNICGSTAFIHNEGFGCGGGVFIGYSNSVNIGENATFRNNLIVTCTSVTVVEEIMYRPIVT